MDLNFKSFGQGPPLVILHGLFGTLDNWQTLGKRWAEHFTVFLVDQRNHGRSPHAEAFDYPTLAADLKVFLEHNWIYKTHVLGHSMGGKTAMQLALD
jgi:pimeloyl-ACP methyl ester carboxylesterase